MKKEKKATKANTISDNTSLLGSSSPVNLKSKDEKEITKKDSNGIADMKNKISKKIHSDAKVLGKNIDQEVKSIYDKASKIEEGVAKKMKDTSVKLKEKATLLINEHFNQNPKQEKK